MPVEYVHRFVVDLELGPRSLLEHDARALLADGLLDARLIRHGETLVEVQRTLQVHETVRVAS